jgi:subtilisin family serine protease
MVSSKALAGLACLVSIADGARVSSKRQASMSVAGVTMENYREDAEDFTVVFKEGTSDADLEEMCKGGCSLTGHPSEGGTAFVKVHGWKQMEELVIKNAGNIDILQPDALDYEIPEIESSDVNAAVASWGLERVGVPEASRTGKGVHIYVQDTGIRWTHQDFGGRASPAFDMTKNREWECTGDDECGADIRGHGTHCAGSAGGKTYGVAPDALLYAIKTLSNTGSGQRSWQYAGVDWVTTKGARPAVLSMSLGGSGTDRTYTRIINQATNAGVVVVVAAGNSNANACFFSPAFVESAITVGATGSDNARARYSNFGACSNIMAPGSAIVSAGVASDDASRVLSGTSMACPHVSGGAALMLQQNPSWQTPQVLARLLSTAKTGMISDLEEEDPDEFLWVGA